MLYPPANVPRPKKFVTSLLHRAILNCPFSRSAITCFVSVLVFTIHANAQRPPANNGTYDSMITSLVRQNATNLIRNIQSDKNLHNRIFAPCASGGQDGTFQAQQNFYLELLLRVDSAIRRAYSPTVSNRYFGGRTQNAVMDDARTKINSFSKSSTINAEIARICSSVPTKPVRQNTAPIVDAGPPQVVTLPNNTATLNGTATDRENNIRTYQWQMLPGPIGGQITSPGSLRTTVINLRKGQVYRYVLSVEDSFEAVGRDTVTVTVVDAPPKAPTANAGPDQIITLPLNSVTLNGSGQDPQGLPLTYSWRRLSGPASAVIVSPTNARTPVQNLVSSVYDFELTVTNNRGMSGRDVVRVTVNQQTVQPPRANAGPDQTITLPLNSVTLNGSGQDPQGLPLKYSWRRLSGPGSVVIVSPTNARTSVQDLISAVYDFELTVTNDKGMSGTDIVRINVNAQPNRPPRANAGPAQTIMLPVNKVTLRGSGVDPDGDPITFHWRKLRGPANAHILSPTNSETVIEHLTLGSYQFILTVSDNKGGADSAIVRITVNRKGLQPPIANAGPDLDIKKDTVTLRGGGTDPDGRIVSYHWTKISGPGKYNIVSPFTANTEIDNLQKGEYQFELAVIDNDGLAATDIMILKVEAGFAVAAWLWIGLGLVLLGGAGYTVRLFWWRSRKEKVIVYFVNKDEKALVDDLLPGYHVTDGYALGHSTRGKISRMIKKGIPLRVLNTSNLTVTTPGATRTYNISFKKGAPQMKSVSVSYPGKNFVNIIGGVEPLPSKPEFPAFYIITLDGPLLPVFRDALEKIGLSILQRIPLDSYLVLVRDQGQLYQLQFNEDFRFVRMVKQYSAEDTGFTIRKDRYTSSKGELDDLVLDLILHRDEDVQVVNDFLALHNIERVDSFENIIRIRIKRNNELPLLLAANKYIQAIYEYVPPVFFNNIARQMIGIDGTDPNIQAITETGNGQIIAVADTGLDQTHLDLTNSIVGAAAWGRENDTTDPHGHGTHVTGTIIGNGSSSNGAIKGMAPGAQVFFQSLLNANEQLCDLKLTLPELLQQAYDNNARILNISWGAPTEASYTSYSLMIDKFVYEHPEMLVVVSAGNERVVKTDLNGMRVPGFGSVSSPATIKNGLTVGASNSERMNGDPESMATFSSRGPCKDRRIKPDIVAPGTNILSLKSAQAPLRNFDTFFENKAYVFLSGTSMATPVVSGAAAIVREYYRKREHLTPTAALVKATLLNGTRQLTGRSAMEGSDMIPNNCQGFGELDLLKTIPNKQSDFALWFRDSITDASLRLREGGERRKFQLQIHKESWVRACLVYLDNAANGIQDDLDLIIECGTDGDVQQWAGNSGINAKDPSFWDRTQDFSNNVEIVRIDQAKAGTYTVEIVATTIVDGSKGFALVVTTGDKPSEFSNI